ncbi:hypothetical protein [Azotosporobacter soli]|uniref:hypothetical protein n=1 Tax=Azotosporobacter soli TaxID=3055040 RepID=UPI0031FE991B
MDELLTAKISLRQKAKLKVKGLTKLKPDTHRQEARVKYVIEKDERYSYTYLVTGAGFKVLLVCKPLAEEAAFEATSASKAKTPDAKRQEEERTCRLANAPFTDCQSFLACKQMSASLQSACKKNSSETGYAEEGISGKDVILYWINDDK